MPLAWRGPTAQGSWCNSEPPNAPFNREHGFEQRVPQLLQFVIRDEGLRASGLRDLRGSAHHSLTGNP
jgi:hypothetical protein